MGYHEGEKLTCSEKGCDVTFVTRQRLRDHIELAHSGTKKEKNPPVTGSRRKRRKDKGKHVKAMAAILTGVEVKTGADKLLRNKSLPLDSVDELAEQCKKFVGESLGAESSDSEAVIGCRRGAWNEFDVENDAEENRINETLLGVVKRLEQDKHFKNLNMEEQSSDTDFETDTREKNETADVQKETKKYFDFTKFLKPSTS